MTDQITYDIESATLFGNESLRRQLNSYQYSIWKSYWVRDGNRVILQNINLMFSISNVIVQTSFSSGNVSF